MRGELSPPRPTPSSPVGGEMVLCSVPNFGGMYSPGTPACTLLGQRKVGMVEGVEHLHVEAQRAVAGGGIDDRDKCVGIEPLPGSGDCDSGDRGFLVERLARNAAGKLRPIGLKNAVAVPAV
jgi:hypothetical protein